MDLRKLAIAKGLPADVFKRNIPQEIVVLASASASDPAADAAAFIAAAGISDPTQEAAIVTLVTTLHATGVWSKLHTAYPLVGGTAAAHAVNLKNPDTFEMTWAGTVTHNANGATGNGTTGYGNTGWNPSLHGAVDNEHMSVYCRSAAATGAAIGYNNNTVLHSTMFLLTGGNFLTRSQCQNSNSVANADSLGYFSINRTVNSGYRKRKNGTSTDVTEAGGGLLANLNTYVMARNNSGVAGNFDGSNYAWFATGSGLTEAEDGDLRTAVEAFQDALSRGVVA